MSYLIRTLLVGALLLPALVRAETPKPEFFDGIRSQKDMNDLSVSQKDELRSYLAARALEKPGLGIDMDSMAVSLDRGSYDAGDSASVSLSWSSDAAEGYVRYAKEDADTVPSIFAKIGIVGKDGNFCAEKTDISFPVTDMAPSFELPVSSDCHVMSIVVAFFDRGGRHIGEWVVEDFTVIGVGSGTHEERVDRMAFLKDIGSRAWAAGLVGMLFIVSLFLILFRRDSTSRPTRRSGPKSFLFVLFFALLFTPASVYAIPQNLHVVCSADATRASFYWDDWETRGGDDEGVIIRPEGSYYGEWDGWDDVLRDSAGYYAVAVIPGKQYDWRAYNSEDHGHSDASFSCEPRAPTISGYASWPDVPEPLLLDEDWLLPRVFSRFSVADAEQDTCSLNGYSGILYGGEEESDIGKEYAVGFSLHDGEATWFSEQLLTQDTYTDTLTCSGPGGTSSAEVVWTKTPSSHDVSWHRQHDFHLNHPNGQFGLSETFGSIGSNTAYEGSWIYKGTDDPEYGNDPARRYLGWRVMGWGAECVMSDSHGRLHETVSTTEIGDEGPFYFIVEPTTFLLRCEDPDGEEEFSAEYTVNVVPDPSAASIDAPTLSFYAASSSYPDPTNVPDGASVDLIWFTDNADSCEVTGGDWYDPLGDNTRGTDGSEPTASLVYVPGDGVYEYQLTCTGAGGSISGNVTVSVQPPMVDNKLTLCTDGSFGNRSEAPDSQALVVGATYNLYAHYGWNGDCSDMEVTPSASWSEDTSSNVVSLSGSSPKTVTANASGTETVSVSYSGASDSVFFSVGSPCASSTCTDEEEAEHCFGEKFTIDNGCEGTATCIGTRNCDFNWREVAPGE